MDAPRSLHPPHAPGLSDGPVVGDRPVRSLNVLDLPTVPELEDCIRCGLCLSVCPTYRPTGVEGDSPRGRVALVKAQVEGKADPATPTFQEHMDLCLQCMACHTVCPTDVSAGAVVARQKSYMRATRPRTPRQRLLLHLVFEGLFPHYGRMEFVSAPLRLYKRSGAQWLVRRGGLLRRLPGPLWLMEALLPARVGRPARRRIPEVTPPRPVGRAGSGRDYSPPTPLTRTVRGGEEARAPRVAFHLCCVNNVMFPDATEASVRVLARNGAEVMTPRGVTCCGAPHETEGEMEVGRALARRNIALYESLDVDYVIADAAACGMALKQYGHWFAHDEAWRARAEALSSRVRDIHEYLAASDIAPPAMPASATGERAEKVRVTYDDPCHLCHGQGISRQPRELLKRIPGIEYVELPEASWCCGSAGAYNITQPEMAETILKDKVEHIRATGADIIASANPGCMLQLEAGLRRYGVKGTVRHVTELLDAAYQGDAT